MEDSSAAQPRPLPARLQPAAALVLPGLDLRLPANLWGELARCGSPRGPRLPAHLQALWDLVQAGHPLARAAALYLHETAIGQSPHTLAAKCRDLVAFVRWFVQINQHADPAHWLPRDTRLYLRARESAGQSPASINRALATLRHLARWLHEQPGALFMHAGLPTRGVKELQVDESACKKLEAREVHALFKAADHLVRLAGHRRARPQRNRAIFALLYFTGLRVSELCVLRFEQLQGHHLVDLVRKGRVRSRGLYLVAEARRHLDDYLQGERRQDDAQGRAEPLFLVPGGGAALDRRDVARALEGLACEANKRREVPIHLHPHRLRHTFGSLHRAKSQSDSETAVALGHSSLKYVGRYTRQSDAEREQKMEEVFDAAFALPEHPPQQRT